MERVGTYLLRITRAVCTLFKKNLFVFSRKNRERRENVISELVVTEREFCRDLKLTWQAFGLDTPAMLEQRGIIFQVKSSGAYHVKKFTPSVGIHYLEA